MHANPLTCNNLYFQPVHHNYILSVSTTVHWSIPFHLSMIGNFRLQVTVQPQVFNNLFLFLPLPGTSDLLTLNIIARFSPTLAFKCSFRTIWLSLLFLSWIPCPVILVAVIKVGDITVAVIWVGSEVWSFWSRSLRSRSFRSWSFLSVF